MARRQVWWLVAALLVAGRAFASTPTDVGASFTSSGATGQLAADTIAARDQNANGLPNFIRLDHNATDVTPNPTCAASCNTGQACLIDIDESATDTWVLCVGTSDFFHIPNTGTSVIGDAKLLVGTGANTGAYVAVTGDVTINDSGVTAIGSDKVTAPMVAFNYAGSASEGGPATTALALNANPTDCSATQYATAIAASGNLTCAQPAFSDLSGSATDAQIPNSITVDLATAATALAANPTDCSASQFATTIAANGNLTCAQPAFSDLSGAATAAQMPSGTNTTTWTIDADATGTEPANGAGLKIEGGSGDITITYDATGNDLEFTGATGGYTFDATITGNLTGAVTGNASTATALAANPTDCSANQFATTIAASGNLTCAQVAFSNLSGSATDAQIPDNITVTLAATATALAANGTNCSAGQYPLGVDASGNVEGCTADQTGGPFSSLTSGTNTAAAMLVGSGASLGTTGTGTITASEVTCTGCVSTTEVASGVTIDTKWDTAAEINAATTDDDFVTLTGTQSISGNKTFSGTEVFTAATLRPPNGSSVPGTCTAGDVYNLPAGGLGAREYLCVATNTWAATDNAFGSEIDATEMANTLTFSGAQVIDLNTNSAAIKLPITASSPASNGVFAIDSTSPYELKWYAGGAVQRPYPLLAGRSSGQTLAGGNTSDGSDNQALNTCAAGAVSDTRGGCIQHLGNEVSITGGSLLLTAGDITTGAFNGDILLYTNNGGNSVFGVPDFGVYNNNRAGFQVASGALPSFDVSIGGQAARTIGLERQTTSNTAGNGLTISASAATTGATDKNGGTLTLQPGVPTGQGKSLISLQTPTRATASGTSDQTMVDRLVLGGKRILTNNSATAVLNATAASGSTVAGIIHYSVIVTNGTDYQVESGQVHYTGVNKAGTVTSTVTETAASTQTLSTGTLTSAWTIGTANPVVVSVNANSSLTPSTGYPLLTFWVENLADQAVALQ